MTSLTVLAAGATTLGLPLRVEQLQQFQAYYETLVEWNARMNLTGITEPGAVQVRHFLDSLTVAAALLRWEGTPPGRLSRRVPAGRGGLADLGTARAFPACR